MNNTRATFVILVEWQEGKWSARMMEGKEKRETGRIHLLL